MVGLTDADQIEVEDDESWEALHQFPLIKFLEQDKRPVFVIDLRRERQNSDQLLHPLFVNHALRTSCSLFEFTADTLINRNPVDQVTYRDFAQEAKSSGHDRLDSELMFGGFAWQYLTLDHVWRVFTGTSCGNAGDSTHQGSHLPKLAATVYSKPPINPSAHPVPRRPRVEASRRSKSNGGAHDQSAHPTASTESIAPSTFFDNVPTSAFRDESRVAKRNAELLAKIAASDFIGIYILDVHGEILFANDAWYNMTQHPREMNNAMSWLNIVRDEDIPRIVELWERVAMQREPVQWEAQLKRNWVAPSSLPDAPPDTPAWISGSSYPDISPNGEIIGVCGILTDISEQKYIESLREQKLADAIERASLMEQLSSRAKEVAESETRFRRLADLSPLGIWISDPVGNVLYANDAWRDIIPGARTPGSNEPWWDMIPPDEMYKAEEYYNALLNEHTKGTIEIRLKASDDPEDDKARWIFASAYPEMNEDGSLKHITGCVTDITHLKLAEQIQTDRANDALESKRQLEHFIDMTSHEMRNPLSAIIHSAEEILSSLCGPDLEKLTASKVLDAVEAARTIMYCTDHSTRIVDDILLVSKLESGLLNISPVVTQPVIAVERALRMFDGEMRAASIETSLVVDDSFRSLGIDWVHLDESRMLQVFVNLITNAIKFTRPEPTRQINIRVTVSKEKPTTTTDRTGTTFHFLSPTTELSAVHKSWRSDNNDRAVHVGVIVSDTGCGLTEEEQKHLFRRFSQAGKRTHVKYGGTGLGLFISRQLCEMQGGQIGVYSIPRQGSVFSFYVTAQQALPDERPNEPSDLSSQTNSGRLTSASRTITPLQPTDQSLAGKLPDLPYKTSDAPASQERTILLVEDNLINQKVVAKKLSGQGYKVLVANHGLEALDHIRKSALWSTSQADAPAISLILLDIEMPVMDGLTCIRCIREMEKSREIRVHVPVIAVTANARQEQIVQIKEAGMDDVVTKPFRINQLIPAMTKLMEQNSVS